MIGVRRRRRRIRYHTVKPRSARPTRVPITASTRVAIGNGAAWMDPTLVGRMATGLVPVDGLTPGSVVDELEIGTLVTTGMLVSTAAVEAVEGNWEVEATSAVDVALSLGRPVVVSCFMPFNGAADVSSVVCVNRK